MIQRMISSACNAPACFIAWKIAITSRGVTPSELRAEATFSTVGNSGSGTTAVLFSVTSVVVRGVTTVSPVLLNGFGCETSRVDATLMVILPCETAHAEMRMRDVATIVPVRSLMMMRAGRPARACADLDSLDLPGVEIIRVANDEFGVKNRMLHGEPDDTRELAALLGVKYKEGANGQFAHSNLITVLNQDGEIVHQLVGLGQDIKSTVRMIDRLTTEGTARAGSTSE